MAISVGARPIPSSKPGTKNSRNIPRCWRRPHLRPEYARSAGLKINGKHYRSVWPIGEDAFGIIDQTKLPHEFVTLALRSAEDAAHAISTMQTRGAPLIGAVGAYGLALAMRDDPSDDNLNRVHDRLAETRPTAINLRWALGRMRDALLNQPHAARAKLAWAEA